jgi:hypothetical protein
MKDADAIYVTCPMTNGTGNIMLKIHKNNEPLLADLGFTKEAEPEKANAVLMSVGDAMRAGIITKIRISLKGTDTKPGMSTKIHCSSTKVAEALGGVPQKLYGGRTITGAGSLRRLRYR